MADHIWKENVNYQPLRDQARIIDSEEYWKIRHLKDVALLLGNSNLLAKPSIEMNTIWEPFIKKAR